MTGAGSNFRREMGVCVIDGVPYVPVQEVCDALRALAAGYQELDNREAALAVERVAVGFDLGLIEAATTRAEEEGR